LLLIIASERARAEERVRAQVIEEGVPPAIREAIQERRFAARPVVMEARFGTGTLVGVMGVTASYNPWSFLGLGVGAGLDTGGGQLAAMISIRPVTFVSQRWARLHAIGIELGYSTGPYNDWELGGDGGSGATYRWDHVHWAQPLLFYQTQSYRGFNLLAGVGAAIPFAKSGYHCIDTELCGGPHINGAFTATAGLGYAWDGGPS
jgi:hypothetical protein